MPSASARPRVQHAVVLAAGNGSRLASSPARPKPAVPIQGRPLLARVLDGLEAAGIARADVVVGYGADAVMACAGADRDALEVRFLHNPRYDLANGVSVLCARAHADDPFLLAMADHLFDADLLTRFCRAPCPHDGHLLATDTKTAAVFDPADATRVQSRDGRVRAIGKGLRVFDAIDTGLFLLRPSVFDAIASTVARGDASLSGGIATLATDGRVHTWDIGPARWIDVDTHDALAEAGRLLDLGLVGAPLPATRLTPA